MPSKPIRFDLRDAQEEDYAFIEQLYVETSEPLLRAFNAWDREKTVNTFKNTHYQIEEVKIILVDNNRAGWLQIRNEDDQIALHQLHIKSKYRNHKIGTRIILETIGRARQENKRMTLSVYKNNRALQLYVRLGFSIISEDETKFHLSISPSQGAQT